MKKLLSIIVLGMVLGVMVAPMAAMAIDSIPNGCTITKSITLGNGDACPKTGCDDLSVSTAPSNCGICCLLQSIYTITDWLFYILTVLVVFMVIWGGFLNITAAGDPEKAAKGRKVLVYAVIGLAIALLAKIVPSVVKFIVGV